MMDRRLVTHPSSEGPWKWHHHCIPRDRNDCHIWTCLLWRGRCGPIMAGRATSPEACPGGDAPHAARQREQFHRGCPRGREGRMRRIPSRAGRLWGPIRVSSVIPLQRWRLGGGCSAAEWQWPHSTRVVSGGPGPRGRRPSTNVGERRTGEAGGTALRGRLLTGGLAASAEVGAIDTHGRQGGHRRRQSRLGVLLP